MMYAGNARSYEKTFNDFTVLFTGKNLLVGGKAYALGQITMDVLNFAGTAAVTRIPVSAIGAGGIGIRSMG